MVRSHRQSTFNTLVIAISTVAVGGGLAIASAVPAGAVTKTAAPMVTSQAPSAAAPPYSPRGGKPAPVQHTATGDAPDASGAQTVINFADLANLAVVTNQYPSATFSSTSGNANYVLDDSSFNTPSFICTGPSGDGINCAADTIVNFTSPVSDLTFDAVGVDDTDQVAEVEVFNASGLVATVPIIGDAGGLTAQTVDLSAYKDVTSIDITDITDSAGIGWTNFSFTPECTSAELSGPSWAAKFPNSKSVADLSGPFQQDAIRFINAMTAAGIKETTIATLRPPQRAYLRHYSWLIAKGKINPSDVPDFMPASGQAAVDICWVHTNANGGENLPASIRAARQMVNAFGIDPNLKAAPALNNLRTQGLAIDMTTTWCRRKITILNGSGAPVTIKTVPRTGLNGRLIAVGSTYGVIHFLNAAKHPNHWSVNGH